MIEEFVKNNNIPKYRIKQFNELFFGKAISSFDELLTWPKDLIEQLKEIVPFSTIEFKRHLVSKKKNTIKVLFRVNRLDKSIETVLMRHKDGRNTVCVSCMVGCPVNCSFCATGKMGFHGNLTSEEIIDQVMYFQRLLKEEGEKVTNVVYMGMGEPMLNLKEVQKSIAVLIDPDKLAMSIRRITVSTSGYVRQLAEFINDGYRGRLAISLHAPNQEIRELLMPVAKQNKLIELLDLMDEYTAQTNKRVSYEYIMIDKVTDKEEHAWELIKLLRHRLAHINLIPYNELSLPDEKKKFKKSDLKNIEHFARILEKNKMPYSIRGTMGADVGAACGQLSTETD